MLKLAKIVSLEPMQSLHHGISIGDNVIIGSIAYINKNCDSNSTYVGIPAIKKQSNVLKNSLNRR